MDLTKLPVGFRLYRVTAGNGEVKLIAAKSRASALRHAAKQFFSITAPTAMVAAADIAKGIPVSVATWEPEQTDIDEETP